MGTSTIKNDWKGLKGSFQASLLSSTFIRNLVSPLIFGRKQKEAIEFLINSELKNGGHFVDLGSGSGYYTLKALKVSPAVKISAVDISEPMLSVLKKRVQSDAYNRSVKIIRRDVTDTGLPDNCANVVMAANLFHEICDPALLAREIYRLLVKGGMVICTEFLNTMIGRLITSHHSQGVHGPYSEEELATTLSGAGLEVVESISACSRLLIYAWK